MARKKQPRKIKVWQLIILAPVVGFLFGFSQDIYSSIARFFGGA
jgi:hypothetical protein